MMETCEDTEQELPDESEKVTFLGGMEKAKGEKEKRKIKEGQEGQSEERTNLSPPHW